MTKTTDQRPTQATFGGWLVMSGSVFLVFSLFSTVSSLRSLQTREGIEEAITQPPLEGLGLSVSQVVSLIHALALVAGACAAATAVLGFYVLRRHRQARLVLTLLAVPLVLTAFFLDVLLVAAVAIAVGMLWSKPSRDWFDGKPRAVPEPPETPAGRGETAQDDVVSRPAAPTSPASTTPEGASGARAWSGYGEPASAASATTTLPREGTGGGRSGHPPTGRGRRPGSVTLACVATWVMGGLVGAVLIGGLFELLVRPDTLLDEVRRQQPAAFDQGVSETLLLTTTAVMCGVLLGWVLAAAVLASFAFRGRNGARIALIVSAAVVGVPCLVAGLFAPVLLAVALAAAVTIAGLVRPEARAWYAGRS